MSEIMTDDEKRATIKQWIKRNPEEIVAACKVWRDANLSGDDELDFDEYLTRRRIRGRKHDIKRLALGWNPLNSHFLGSEGHHINDMDVIYIPKVMHRSVYHNIWTGRGMEQINSLARQYLDESVPSVYFSLAAP